MCNFQVTAQSKYLPIGQISYQSGRSCRWSTIGILHSQTRHARCRCLGFFGTTPQKFSGQKTPSQGCQMVYIANKISNLGKFWRVLQWKMLVYFVAIWYIVRLFGILEGYLVYFTVILIYFPVLVCCTKKNLAILLRPTVEVKFLWSLNEAEKRLLMFWAADFCAKCIILLRLLSRASIQ
jgi:hypothetical protein